MKWVFERHNPMGGAVGEAFSNPLIGSGLSSEEMLAREAIQNSVDAFVANGHEKARVKFRRVGLVGQDKQDFIDALKLELQVLPRSAALNQGHETCFDDVAHKSAPFQLLYIDDFGTHGLNGDPHEHSSPFFKLLLSLGDSQKAHSKTTSGGSFGYGKGVYSSSSRISSIVAFSAFSVDGQMCSRLMACSYYKSHEFEGNYFTGRAWFGEMDQTIDQLVHPLEGSEAENLAKQLGFESRDINHQGTSVLILDCHVDLSEIKKAVEKWWWPKIVSNELDVELYQNEARFEPPKPKSRPDLRPYINCYSMINGLSRPRGDHESVGKFNKSDNVDMGSYGFSALEEDVDEDLEGENDEFELALNNRVALVRGPKMVVAYEGPFRLALPSVGVYVASDELDPILKLSEPPAHDRWDEKSSRLQEGERQRVHQIRTRVASQFRKFSRNSTPPEPRGPKRPNLLERMLGGILRTPAERTGPGAGASDAQPISIRFIQEPELGFGPGSTWSQGEFQVSLADSSERSELLVSIALLCTPIEDEGGSADDLINVSITPVGGTQSSEDPDTHGRIVTLLSHGTRSRFSFRSENYPPDWATKVTVDVQEVI